MSARVAYRTVRSRRKFINAPGVKAKLGKVLDNTVKPELIKRFERVTANWEHKVQFRGRKQIRANNIQVSIFPVGENKMIWIWVSGGTKGPYPITPKRAPFLVFAWGGPGSYKPKTSPPGKFGGPGVVRGGSIVKSKGVTHPGIKARDFEKIISADYKKTFSKKMESEWRKIIRRL